MWSAKKYHKFCIKTKSKGKKSGPPRKPREAGGPAGGSGKPPGEGASAGDVEEEKVVNDETDMLDSLTGMNGL